MNPSTSMPSPISPYDQHRRSMSASRSASCYPTSPNMDGQQQQQHGLGLYHGPMGPPSTTVSPALASPPTDWPHPQAPHQPAYSTSQPPDIFSAAFDPFSGFSAASNTGMVGTHSPEAPGLEFCQTPPSSNLASHRGSVSSYSPSDAGSNGAYTPRAKPEDAGGEWYAAQGQDLQRGLPAVSGPYGPAPTMASQTEQLYREPSSDALYRPQPEFTTDMAGDKLAARFDAMPAAMQPVLPSATRVRKRRQRTTPEEATHECRVCGKLFKRSYNWKSHMETHNPDRKYPHPCPHMVGSTPCTKKFQRKTDLDRHVDSVHLKSRNHKCALCGNRFARRDTLRRHTEDGCPKRFELNLREQHANVATAEPTVTATGHRWSYPTPTSAGFGPAAPRDRAFSTTSAMGPPPMPTAASYSAFAPQTAAAAY